MNETTLTGLPCVIELAGDAILSKFSGSLSEHKLNNSIQFISQV